MAFDIAFYSAGGLSVKKGNSYTIADLPTYSPTIVLDILRIKEAGRIWRPDLDIDGNQNKQNGSPLYVKGAERGVRILIQRAGATFPIGSPNTPVLYKEGEEIGLHANNTYTFFGDCIVEFGTAK